jgi:hypothetical protein
MPLQKDSGQELLRITSLDGGLQEENLGAAQFVPLVGRHGFDAEEGR